MPLSYAVWLGPGRPLDVGAATVRPGVTSDRCVSAVVCSVRGGGGAGGGGQGREHVVDGLVVVGGRDEPRLEGARRQVDPLAQHRVEEPAEGAGVLVLGVVVVRDGPSRKKTENIEPAHWIVCGTETAESSVATASAIACETTSRRS